jgi:hypothetical protein
MIIRFSILALFLIVCIAVTFAANGQNFKAGAPDAGEASSGNYGETSITYSSSDGDYSGDASNGYSAYQGTSGQNPKYLFSTHPRNTQQQVAQQQASTTHPGVTNTAAQTFQAPQSSDQQTLLAYNVLENQPDAVFYSQVMQPWQQFVSAFPKNMPMFWVNTKAGWQWYATCPLGGWAQEIMFIPQTGTLGEYEIYPDRTAKYYSYGYATPGYHYIWFNGDTPGRHNQIITVDNIPSNAVAFDVV